MLNHKLQEVLSHPSDGIVAIVSQGSDGAHVVNSWNSYVNVKEDEKLLLPVGGMNKTQQNVEQDNKVKITIGNREVEGLRYKGTGFLIKGTAEFLHAGPDFDFMKEKFPWARAVLEITPASIEQTL